MNHLTNQTEMPNILWFQHLKCENQLLFSVLDHCKLNIFVVWSVGYLTV